MKVSSHPITTEDLSVLLKTLTRGTVFIEAGSHEQNVARFANGLVWIVVNQEPENQRTQIMSPHGDRTNWSHNLRVRVIEATLMLERFAD